MDFFIPDVPLEQIRFAGLRLQRGGVGFYPTSGSPFVHLDTGSIRHWPRMTHDQLARVFPDGRTVHVPSDGNPLSGYQLARADIEKRGDGDIDDVSSKSKPGLFASLFKGKSNDEDDEGAGAPVAAVTAAAASAKSTEPVPMPRSKPAAAATFQLASADSQIVQPGKSKPAVQTSAQQASTQQVSAQKAEPRAQTPADIINARGFWGDASATPKQATPAQIAAISARQALASADPQSTASISDAFQALAYAPAATPAVDRSAVVTASAPMPRSIRPASSARNSAPSTTIDSVAAKGPQDPVSVVATSTRIAAAKGNDVWMRVMILAPSASTSMSATVLGDTDLTSMRAHFAKPQAAVAMSFSEDPQMGLVSDQFTGSATATLATQTFVLRTASLR
jgi:Bacterial protein of unknown function (DUF882)